MLLFTALIIAVVTLSFIFSLPNERLIMFALFSIAKSIARINVSEFVAPTSLRAFIIINLQAGATP